MNCNKCAKRDICTKASNFENYRLKDCSEFVDAKRVMTKFACPVCLTTMDYISEYTYSNKEDTKVEGDIYHCPNCDHDEVIESTWKLTDRVARQYFHG